MNEGSKKCPYCAETIKVEAIVCRFCNRDLTGVPRYTPNNEAVRQMDSALKLQKIGLSVQLVGYILLLIGLMACIGMCLWLFVFS